MKIYYQGFPGAYGNEVAIKVATKLKIEKNNVIGVTNFKKVFDKIGDGDIGVLPIENSYAGSVHENFYHLISGDYEIIGEIFLDIDHYLLSNSKDKKDIKFVYSHPQALAQCHNFIEKNKYNTVEYADTAGSAKYVSETRSKEFASISSKLCSSIYGLNIIDKHIQDQAGNTTRFFVVVSKSCYKKIKKIWS